MKPNRWICPSLAAFIGVVWAIGMTTGGKWDAFVENWAMGVTMIFGSFVAGSTPAGGGSVAFPIFTKVLNVEPGDARTFSLMIQAVGMSMASLLIFTWRIPIYSSVLRWTLPAGLVGLTIGTLFDDLLPNGYGRLLFTLVAGVFGGTLIITHWILKFAPTLEERFHLESTGARALFIIFGAIGGVISSQIGSGLDMVCFTLMTLAFGLLERRAIPTCVIMMAALSVWGFFLHATPLTPPIGVVWDYWLACVPIVAIGAPVGAFVASRMKRETFIIGILLLIALECISTAFLIPIGVPEASFIMVSFVAISLCFWAMIRLRSNRSDLTPDLNASRS
ncbi:MAG: sulfite exporter TauE/SafE family protein [Verrucomicrobiota bacterium]